MKTVTLAEIVQNLDSGARPPGGANGLSEGVPSLGAEHLDGNGGFRFENLKRIPREFFDEMRSGRIQPGDILIVKDGATTGKTSFVGPSFPFSAAAVNEHVFRLTVDRKKAYPRYVFHYLASARGQYQVLRDFRGATIGGISRGFIDLVEIPLPPLSEQKRIAAILDKADAIRRRRQEATQQTDQLVPSVFYEMFGDPVTNRKSWPVRKLGDVAQLDRGKSRHRPRDEPSLYGGPYPFVQTGDIANSHGLITEYSQTYSELGLAQSKLWPAGTLCITIAANIAKTAILTFDACFPDSVVGLMPSDTVQIDYVREWFVAVEKTIDQAATQVAQKNINLAILRNLDIPVPPRQLQDQFAEHASRIRRRQAANQSTLRESDDLFNSLVQRAFGGKL